MNDLAVLHLSDLHIDNHGTTYSRLLKGLLSDIKKEVETIPDGRLVVVVTGDIIHKGDKKAIGAAKKFFLDLKNMLAKKVAGIYIVPGNHDKARTEENQFLISACRSLRNSGKAQFDDVFYQSLWPMQLQTYSMEHGSGYLELAEYIYDLFNVDAQKDFVKDTFGVDVLTIGDKNYCFVLLNTAWSCADDNDMRNLIFGDFQMQKIKCGFHDITDSLTTPPCLTLVLGHHPIGCLHGLEEDQVFSEMISFEELDANVYLCGHTHDRTIINWYNNRHSLNTLMTGIGWPESGSGMHVGDHYYSLYMFNLDENSIDVYVKNTNDGGTFSPDFKIYTNGVDPETKKLVLPIRAHDAHAYVSLGAGGGSHEKAIYVSNAFLSYAKKFSKKMGRFCQEAGSWIESDKNGLFDGVESENEDELNHAPLESEEKNSVASCENGNVIIKVDEVLYNYLFADMSDIPPGAESILEAFFTQNQESIFEMFLGFLQRICQRLQKILLYDQLSTEDVVRFHFRYLSDRNTYLYCNLCSSFSIGSKEETHKLSDIKYGDLIEAADKTNRCLIYSANEQICSRKLDPKWQNFITAVPKFQGNEFRRKVNEDTTKNVPYITFGVTINSSKFNDLLYCLDFYSIDSILANLLESYVNLYRIDIGKFCSWFKEQQRKEMNIRGTENTPN